MSRIRSRKSNTRTPLVLVAGGAGFIGSHLSESLLNSGVNVLGVDDLVTGSMANIASFRRHPNFEFIEYNVNQGIPASLKDKPITHIVHVMGVDTHTPNTDATLSSLLTGSFGTKNLLDLAVKTGATFLLASTINVYEGLASSTSLDHYFGSTDEQRAQYSNYEAKRYAEGLCQMYADEFNLDVRVARLSTVYGPRMDLCDSTFLDTMIQNVLDERDLIVEGDGNQEIYLTYVDDVVFGLSKLLFAEGEQFRESIYPLVSPEKTSILSVAYTLRTFLPPGKEIKFLSQAEKEVFGLPLVAFDRAKRDLNWEPAVNLTEGLKVTIESFRKGASQQTRIHKIGREQLITIAPESSEKPKPAAAVRVHTETPSLPATLPSDTAVEPLAPLIPESNQTLALPFRQSGNGEEQASNPVKNGAASKNSSNKSKNAPEESVVSVKVKRKSWWRRLFLAALLIGMYVGIGRPVVHTITYGVAGGITIQQATQQAKALDFVHAEDSFHRAQELFALAGQQSTSLRGVSKIVGLYETQQELERGLGALSATSDGLALVSGAVKPWPAQLQALAQFHRTDAPPLPIQKMTDETRVGIQQGKKQLGRALSLLSGAENTQVAGASMDEQSERIGETGLLSGVLGQARLQLSTAQSYLLQVEQVLEVLPTALGAEKKQQYLVMFQNSNELRPTGGFMGSYALIGVERGRLVSFKIDDVYNPDGQLQSNRPAPGPLAKQLGVGSLFIRDANWSVDVGASAKQIAQLYTQATEEPVDGVMFVTTKAITPLLQVLGPIRLENFNEVVTADNFDMLAQRHSNVSFIPGSTNKRDFLGVLAEALMARIEQGGSGDLIAAGKALSQGLQQKEIQLHFADPAIAVLVDQQDWSGRLKDTDKDYLRVVDANIGANKSNYYITRSTSYSINVDRDSHLSGVVKITWKHRGTSGTWPGGDYLNYVRVYAPAGAALLGARDFNTDTEIDVVEEGGKQVFGGYVTVPYGSTKTVELTYRLPDRLGLLEANGEYELLWQKQSGIVREPLTVSFNAPLFLRPTAISKSGKTEQGSIVWNHTGEADTSFMASLKQQ